MRYVLVVCAVAMLSGCSVFAPDPSPTPEAFLTSTDFGTINVEAVSVDDVPYGTMVGEFKEGLAAVAGVTVDILDSSGGTSVADSDALVESPMVISGIDESGLSQEITINMEVLSNETVIVIDGEVLRFDVDYEVGATEFFLQRTDGGSHYYMNDTITSGEYNSEDPDEHMIAIDLVDEPYSVFSTYETETMFTVTLTDNEIGGTFEGFLDEDGTTLHEAHGWFQADRD